jgi:RNA polymerase sigma factor (sigma-70 family)
MVACGFSSVMEDRVMPLERRDHLVEADAAFEALYRAQWAGMVRLAFVLVDDVAVAEELVQDVFVRMYRTGTTARDPLPYLRSAVYNACRNHHRHQRVRRRHLAAVTDSEPPFGDHVIDAVRSLRPQRRAVVVLRYYAGLTDAEIAATIGAPVGTVKSTLHRALAELREALS